MRLLIQRVTQAEVTIDGKTAGKIGKGFLVLIGVCDSDTRQTADLFIRKMLGLRIFEDENGKTNLSLKDVGGELLLVPQFTLYADCRKGNRPGFTDAGSPEHARELYEYVVEECRRAGYSAQTGEFGADMKVSLVNDGPFTIMLDEHLLGK
jgi:D-tyrosyl-tRNA(Tyr) deacylase